MAQSQTAFVPRHFVRSTTEPGSLPQASVRSKEDR
jgi:hypothetical protein